MAKRKPLTRLIVNVRGKPCQLLKIRDRKSDLAIISVSAALYSDPPYAGRAIEVQRYSVHPSNDSELPLNEIKQTLRLEGGALIETVLDSTGPKSGKIQLIFCRACPDLGLPKNELKEDHPRDTIISIGSYNPNNETLLFGLFVTLPGGPTRIAGSRFFSQKAIECKNYRLIAAWATVGVPSTHKGFFRHAMTSNFRLNKEPPKPALAPPSGGRTPKEARSALLAIFDDLRQNIAHSLNENGFGAIATAVNKAPQGFGRRHNLRQQVRRVARRKGPILTR